MIQWRQILSKTDLAAGAALVLLGSVPVFISLCGGRTGPVPSAQYVAGSGFWLLLIYWFAALVWSVRLAQRPGDFRAVMVQLTVTWSVNVALLACLPDGLSLATGLKVWLLGLGVVAGWLAATASAARWHVSLGVLLWLLLGVWGLGYPVTCLPVLHAVGAAGSPWLSTSLTWTSPALALLGALSPQHPFVWTQTNLMYTLTAFGQDIGLSLPPWGITLGSYGLVALLWGMYNLWPWRRKTI
ncbi:MAG: hypothetical protein WCJ97_07595 [Phycisphaerae bacterium]